VELNDRLENFRKEFCKGKLWLRPSVLSLPNSDLQSRPLDLTWVKKLQQHFSKRRSVNNDIQVVVRSADPLKDFTEEGLLKLGKPLETLCGNHSVHAVKNLQEVYPSNPLFQKLHVIIFHCPDTANHRDCLRSLAGLDNLVKGAHRQTTPIEMVLSVHDTIVSELKRYNLKEGEYPSEVKRRLNDILKEMRMGYQQSVGTWSTIASLARKSGLVWLRLHQLFTGQGMGKDYEVPTTLNPFNYLGNLPPQSTLRILTQACQNEISISKLPSVCKMEKARLRVYGFYRDTIAVYGKKAPANVQSISLAKLSEIYPKTTSSTFLDSWIPFVQSLKLTAACPPELLQALKQHISFDESIERSEVSLLLMFASFVWGGGRGAGNIMHNDLQCRA